MKNIKAVDRKKDLSTGTIELIHWFQDQAHWQKDPCFNRMCIHVADCLECGTITPMEGYDIQAYVHLYGLFPEWPKARASNYSHTI
jgi:hypothetical protein